MAASLNLTPERGPSVWANIDRGSTARPWDVWLVVAGIGLIAIGFLYSRTLRKTRPVSDVLRFPRNADLDDALDRAGEESFPASDPPALTAEF